MPYKKIGVIDNISDIPLGKPLILNGKVSRTGWMWRITGEFKEVEGKIIFTNEHGCVTEVEKGQVSLSVLEKI